MGSTLRSDRSGAFAIENLLSLAESAQR
jgi:hypothetical protein